MEASLRGSPGSVMVVEVVRQSRQVNRARQEQTNGYQERTGKRERREKACDGCGRGRSGPAGLSQTDRNRASVSGTLFGKHMPRESSPPTLAAHSALRSNVTDRVRQVNR